MQNKTFRLFISSTFSDFSLERELLQKEVFPEIESYCESNGFQFQAIDLRWGVNEEAQLDQKTLEICLEEVKICKNYPHPNFLIMAGNRYGWVPIPYVIEQTEFEIILKYIEQNNKILNIEHTPYIDKNGNSIQLQNNQVTQYDLLNQWYKLDENQINPSYVLQARTNLYSISEIWNSEENCLRSILQETVNTLNFNEKDKYKYFTSATEHEVIEGIFEYLDLSDNQKKLIEYNPQRYTIDSQYVYSFLRDIVYNKSIKLNNFIDVDETKIKDFKNKIINTLNSNNILNTSTILSEDNTLQLEYLNSFKVFISKKLKDAVKKQIDFVKTLDYKDIELIEQSNFLQHKIESFIGRIDDKNVIHQYIQSNIHKPLIVYGKSGLGKSSLIAQIIDELDANTKRDTIFRFVGATPQSSDTKNLLWSIFNQLNYPIDISLSVEDISLKFYEFLVSHQEKLLLIIDAVDQFYNKDNFTWLPIELPSNIKIIITALKDENYSEDSKYFQILSNYHDNLYELKELNIDKQSISELLSLENRKLTNDQLVYVADKYNAVQSPLYLKIAIEEIKHWKSTDCIKKNISIESTQKAIIKEFIQNLVSIYNHKSDLISKVMGYIQISNEGLSEKELLDFLSMDEDLLNTIVPQNFHINYSTKLPMSVWARLQFHLKPFISTKNIDGILLMQFFHREFNDAIKDLFSIKDLHLQLINLTYEKIRKDNYDFHTNRIGKLYTNLTINYSIQYKDEEFLNTYFEKLTLFNETWLLKFLKYIIDILSDYFKSGLITEAKLIGLSIYSNQKLLKIIDDKYDFFFILGELEQNQGLTKKAIDFYKLAYEYATTDNLKVQVQIQIAKTLRHSGDVSQSAKILSQLLNELLIEDSIEKADAMIQLGLCKLSDKNYTEALRYYELADKYIINHTNNRKLKLYNWLGISTVIAFMGDVQKGLDLLIKIKNESQQFGYQNFYIDSLNGISKKYLLLGDYLEAEKYALDALKLGEKQANSRICFLMHGYLVEAYAGQYKNKLRDQEYVIENANKHLSSIEKYKQNNLVTEKLLNELVDESAQKWNDMSEENNAK